MKVEIYTRLFLVTRPNGRESLQPEKPALLAPGHQVEEIKRTRIAGEALVVPCAEGVLVFRGKSAIDLWTQLKNLGGAEK